MQAGDDRVPEETRRLVGGSAKPDDIPSCAPAIQSSAGRTALAGAHPLNLVQQSSAPAVGLPCAGIGRFILALHGISI